MPPILSAQSVTKQFGAVPLFRDIAFTVADGDRIGLIGPNGAGKTTLLKILAGPVRRLRRGGHPQARPRRLCPQESSFAPGGDGPQVLERP